MEGQAAPGLPAGITFYSAGTPIMNQVGQFVFAARIVGPEITTDNGFGIWSNASGTLQRVAANGTAMPGLPNGVTVIRFHNGSSEKLFINSQGEIALHAQLHGNPVDSSNDLVVMAQRNGMLEIVAREGDAMPGEAGDVRYGFIRPTAFNNQGQVALLVDLTGTDTASDTDQAVLSLGPGGLVASHRESDAAPGTEPGVVFEWIGAFNQPNLTDAGEMIFHGRFDGPNINGFTDEAVFRSSGSGTSIIVRDGDLPPTVPGGSGYKGFSPIGTTRVIPMDRQGHVAFSAGWQNLDNIYENGIVVVGPTNNRIVARFSDQVPGTPAGTTLRNQGVGLAMNGEGDVLYRGYIQGPDVVVGENWGVLVREFDGQQELIAREADPLPELGAGYTLGSISTSQLVMNDVGQVLFLGTVDGPGLSSANRTALFATTPDDELRILLRENDLFDVNDDPLVEDLRFIDRFDFDFSSHSNGVDGRGSVFTNDGRFAVSIEFDSAQFGAFIGQITDNVPGDVNGDGLVNQSDRVIVLGNWGDAVGVRAIGSGDLSNDGIVNEDDLNIFLEHLPAPIAGDLNGDGALTNGDISAFVQALTDPDGYTNRFPGLDPDLIADFDGSGVLTNGDIAGFVDALTGNGGSAAPEPAANAMLALGGLLLGRRRRARW